MHLPAGNEYNTHPFLQLVHESSEILLHVKLINYLIFQKCLNKKPCLITELTLFSTIIKITNFTKACISVIIKYPVSIIFIATSTMKCICRAFITILNYKIYNVNHA